MLDLLPMDIVTWFRAKNGRYSHGTIKYQGEVVWVRGERVAIKVKEPTGEVKIRYVDRESLEKES